MIAAFMVVILVSIFSASLASAVVVVKPTSGATSRAPSQMIDPVRAKPGVDVSRDQQARPAPQGTNPAAKPLLPVPAGTSALQSTSVPYGTNPPVKPELPKIPVAPQGTNPKNLPQIPNTAPSRAVPLGITPQTQPKIPQGTNQQPTVPIVTQVQSPSAVKKPVSRSPIGTRFFEL